MEKIVPKPGVFLQPVAPEPRERDNPNRMTESDRPDHF